MSDFEADLRERLNVRPVPAEAGLGEEWWVVEFLGCGSTHDQGEVCVLALADGSEAAICLIARTHERGIELVDAAVHIYADYQREADHPVPSVSVMTVESHEWNDIVGSVSQR